MIMFLYFPGMGLYFLFALPALLLGFWAQLKVRNAYNKYSKVRSYVGETGAQIARRMLDSNGLQSVGIQQTNGMLTDHYDPTTHVLSLSPQVYQVNSIAAAGVAAHEAGHALQHQAGYAPLQVRSMLVPTVQIGSWLGPIIFLIGLFLSTSFGTTLAWIGLGLFGLTAVFALVTLPVEFDASNRAKAWLSTSGVLLQSEMEGINSVLDAAALTYVAAAIQAISTMLYYGFLLLGGSRRR